MKRIKIFKKGRKKIWVRICKIKEADRTFDILFWQSLSANKRFEATWQMLKEYEMIKGRRSETKLRLQRTVQNIKQT